MKVVIVGGVAGGATASARLRRLDESAEIKVFERSGYVSYANCGLPYYIGDVITDRKELVLQTPEKFYNRFNIDIKVKHEVVSINPEEQYVTVKNLISGEVFDETYDKLLLSPGAHPTVPAIEGADLERVFTLRTVEDTFEIKDYINNNNIEKAVLVGGGFIGVELAENLKELGLDVTIVQKPTHLLSPYDEDMAVLIHRELRDKGVNLIFNSNVEKIQMNSENLSVIMDNGQISTEMVILAIGVTPETKLAKDVGMELGIKDSIVVNDRMETSIPNIYAVGDAVQIKNYVTNLDATIALAGPANKQGRIAADNICGLDTRYKGGLGSSIIKVFDMTAAVTGINERTAKKLGYDYEKIILSPMNHAGYYPGGAAMSIKVIFERESYKILGAQIIGRDGVDKRIDVLATAIFSGLKVTDLQDIDFAYAPPYASAKDPINIIGYMADNIKKGFLKQWYLDDLDRILKDDAVLLDTRTTGEFQSGHVDGFINIPVDELRDRIDEIDKDKKVYLMCQSGQRSYVATRILRSLGYDAYNFTGGYRYYSTVINEEKIAKAVTACGMNA